MKRQAFYLLFSLLFGTGVTKASWFGSECCVYAIEPSCKTSCEKISSIDGITVNCSTTKESEFFSCVSLQKNINKCCTSHRTSHDVTPLKCEQRCADVIKLRHNNDVIPRKLLSDVRSECGNKMATCVGEDRNTRKTSNRCCEISPNSRCRRACKDIYQRETDAEVIVDHLEKKCGKISLLDPFWTCLINEDSSDVGELPLTTSTQCCHKAWSSNCRDECLKLYPAIQPSHFRWEVFEQSCMKQQQEYEMKHCFAETSEPCTVGCSNMEFCTNFNNRHSSLFRNCNKRADNEARRMFEDWKRSKKIKIPGFSMIELENVDSCETEKWKAIACIINIKPCSSYLGEFNICKDDCLDMLSSCSVEEHDYRKSNSVCDKIINTGYSHKKTTCIKLSTYTVPAQSEKVVRKSSSLAVALMSSGTPFTTPCGDNISPKCQENEVCLVNRDAGNIYSATTCVPGCSLDNRVSIPHGHVITTPSGGGESGGNCREVAVCDARSANHKLRKLKVNYCIDDFRKECMVDERVMMHLQTFERNCNFCACFNGKVLCTKSNSCKNPNRAKKCDCSLTPPCGENVLDCYDCQQFCESRSMSNVETCESNPCKRNEKCTPTKRVCLAYGPSKKCPQYECIPKQRKCKKLIKNAVLQHEGSFFDNYDMKYNKYERILSSSLFFSNMHLATNPLTNVCDENSITHKDICTLAENSNSMFSYHGKCKDECTNNEHNKVCGYDGVTYDHVCQATTSGALVQYKGPCVEGCNVECVHNASSCSADQLVFPPNSCCPVCGGMMRVLFDRQFIREVVLNEEHQIWKDVVTVKDVSLHLGRFIDVFECKLWTHLTDEDDLAVLIVPSDPNNNVLVKVCQSETERLNALINQRHPKIATDLILSSLVASRLSAIPTEDTPPSSANTNTFYFAHLICLLLFYFIS